MTIFWLIFYAHTGKGLDPFNILGRITLYYTRPLPKSIRAMCAADQAASINTAAQSRSVRHGVATQM